MKKTSIPSKETLSTIKLYFRDAINVLMIHAWEDTVDIQKLPDYFNELTDTRLVSMFAEAMISCSGVEKNFGEERKILEAITYIFFATDGWEKNINMLEKVVNTEANKMAYTKSLLDNI